jgi:predicted ester cyclase
MAGTSEANKAVATRFIEAFNTDDWDTVREVVAVDFVFHHPEGGTVAAGPEGMVAAWSAFKAAVPDGWHPIPILIAEGDYVANLLPTYGRFTGEAYHGIPTTNAWLEYGMVNMVRFRDGKLAEAWFGMDPLAEKQQMGVAPSFPARQLSTAENAAIESFQRMTKVPGTDYDTLTAFGNIVVALGPPQFARDTKVRTLGIYRVDGEVTLVRSHEFPTIPPYAGDLAVRAESSKTVVINFFEDVLVGHDFEAVHHIISPDVLVHPTAMPCEATYYGVAGIHEWLTSQWRAFPDLTIPDYFVIGEGDIVVARWQARGTSQGEFMMIPPTGEMVTFTGQSMYRVEDGMIAEIWDTRNTLGLMAQLNPDLMAGHHH